MLRIVNFQLWNSHTSPLFKKCSVKIRESDSFNSMKSMKCNKNPGNGG